ncbi:MAG: TatD family hydrolase [Oscillospiraceae bacterium]
MYFDTHAHYDDSDFDADRTELLDKDLPEAGISLVLNPGCNRASSELAIRLAENYDYFYAAVGWHPSDARDFDLECERFLFEWAKHPKVKAIGEIGLDYFHNADYIAIQKQVFRRQLEIANELKLPVIVHDRDAHGDCMAMIAEFPALRGVFHCYSGSAEMAKELVRRGWYLSFTGAITFKNARKAPEVISEVPMERIMIETDSPYLTPVPYRGRRNDSRNLPLIAEKIAEVKGLTVEQVARLTAENGRRFFEI